MANQHESLTFHFSVIQKLSWFPWLLTEIFPLILIEYVYFQVSGFVGGVFFAKGLCQTKVGKVKHFGNSFSGLWL